jgi:hypothetical protein
MAVQDPIASPVVLEMYERYATDQYYDQDIADWLNTQGVHTFLKHPFTKDSAREMLQNPFYTGYVHYRGTFAEGKYPHRRDALPQVKDLLERLR